MDDRKSDSDDSAVEYEDDDGARFKPRPKAYLAKAREEDPTIEKERKYREACQMYIALIRICKLDERTSKTIPCAPKSDVERRRVEEVWLRFFNAMNHVMSPVTNFSASDVGFKAICWSMRIENAMHPDITECTIHWIAELFAQTTVFSCQHTIDSAAFWPSAAEFALYKRRVAAVVTTFFEVGEAKGHGLLIKTIDDPFFKWKGPVVEQDEPGDTPEQKLRKDFLRLEYNRFDSFRVRYQQLKFPPRLTAQREKKKAAQLAEHARKEERAGKKLKMSEDRGEVAEEASGAIWRNSSMELILNFVPRAARLVNRIMFDEQLLVKYPAVDNPFKFAQFALDKSRAWAAKKAIIAAELHKITDLIRALFCEFMSPLGTDTARYRNKKTSSDVTQPLILLQGEIGLDLAQMLHETMLQPVVDYMDLHDGQYWPAVFLALVELEMRQKLMMADDGKTWFELYVIINPHSDKARERMDASTFMMHHDKRPIMVWACRRWWVFFQKSMWRCADVLDAFLTWLSIIKLRFATTVGDLQFQSFDSLNRNPRQPATGDEAVKLQRYMLENKKDIRCVYEKFLDDDSIVP
jgi:hypothetical protein